LFKTYNFTVPVNDAASKVTVPGTLAESYKAGIKAEENNIAMYDKFLKENLPADVKVVFENLKAASEKHLAAFKRADSGTGVGMMQGNTSNRGQMNGQQVKGNSSAGNTSGLNGNGNRNNGVCIFQ
jgi:hypothetical protein